MVFVSCSYRSLPFRNNTTYSGVVAASPSDGQLGHGHGRFSGAILTSVTSILSFQPSQSQQSSETNFSFVLAHPYHPLSSRFVRSVNDYMQHNPDERFRHLQESGEAWVVLSVEAPYILLHAT